METAGGVLLSRARQGADQTGWHAGSYPAAGASICTSRLQLVVPGSAWWLCHRTIENLDWSSFAQSKTLALYLPLPCRALGVCRVSGRFE